LQTYLGSNPCQDQTRLRPPRVKPKSKMLYKHPDLCPTYMTEGLPQIIAFRAFKHSVGHLQGTGMRPELIRLISESLAPVMRLTNELLDRMITHREVLHR